MINEETEGELTLGLCLELQQKVKDWRIMAEIISGISLLLGYLIGRLV